jgi:hypothetical protein
VSADEVTIDKIENMRRSGRGLLAGSIRVDTSIVAADQTAANSMANALTVHKINAELGKNGLPQAEILDPPQVKQIVKDDLKENEKKKEESNKTPIIVAAVVSSVVILFAVGACVFIRRRRTATKKADTHVWTDVAGAETLPSPQAARASAPPVPTTTTSSERRTESPSPPIELDQVMMGDNIELDQVMMDVALTRARPTMTAVTPVQLPEINPIDFSKPPEEVKSKIAKRIKEVMSKANFTLSADTGFINTVPMEGNAELMVAAEVAPARTSEVIPESTLVAPARTSEVIPESTRKTPAPQETYTSPLFKENNLAYVDLQSPSSGQTLAPVARMAQASLGSDPANKIRDRLKAMFPAAEDDIESSEDEKDSAAVHG